MPPIQARLQRRHPHWFRGRRAYMARSLLRTLSRWSRLDDIDAFLARSGHLRGFAFVEAAMAFVGMDYGTDDDERLRIPARGRLLVVANHPSGALDALALLHCVGRVRRDVRIVANDMLAMVDPLADLLLPVRVFGGRPSQFKFGHLAEHRLPDGRVMIDSYHCSRYNQNTGRLTREMFEAVFARAVELRG